MGIEYTKLTFNIESAPKPYLFIGSKIRGTLGYTLKEEVCINPSFICKDCFAAKDCIFYKMYEEQNVTHDYILDFKLYSDKFKFSILLFDGLKNHKDIINKAILKSLKEYKRIEHKIREKKLKIKNFSSVIKIEFITPLRIKKDKRLARKDIELFDILSSIDRRHRALTKEPYEVFSMDIKYKTISKHLNYQELTRRSVRQDVKMQLGGLMGEMIISDVDRETYRLLKLGEVIGVGKSTVFGLGKIKIEELVNG